MKQLLTLVLICISGITVVVNAQLPDGSIAPNWTRTDIDGNTHTLYDYLDQGKMVVVEFSATWCGPCWNYMLTGALETVWEEHGPDGDNTVMMFYIEADMSTGMNDLLGLTPSSQGNWVEAIPFPIIDLQPGQNEANAYDINYYPTLFAVCSDHTLWELGQVPAASWSSFIQSCTLEGAVDNVEDAPCFGEGSVSVEASGGVSPVSYVWNTGATGPTLNNVGAGTYSVTITEAGGKWVVLEDIVVGGADEPLAVEQSEISEPECFGFSNGIIDIEVEGGTPGYEYDWSNGSNFEDLEDVSAGIYTVVITDDNGCSYEQTFSISEPDELLVEFESTPENCDLANGTVTLFIEGGTGGYDISSSEGTISGNQIINLPEGTVTAIVEDANGCAWEQEIEIAYIAAPEVEIYQGQELNCVQLTTTLSGFPAGGSGDYDYEWSTVNGNIIGNSNLQTVTINEEGTYNLLVLDFETGCETETSFLVNADIILPFVDAGINLPITCETNQPTIQGSGDPMNAITWTTVTGNIVSGGTTYTPVVSAPGMYYINVVNSATNCTNVDSMQIINELDPATAAFQYQTSSLTIVATDISTGSNLSGWSWTFGDGTTSTEQSPVHTYATAGTYQVCLSVQNGCGPNQTCSQVEVVFTGSVLSLDVQINNVLCNGDATGSITLVANGGSGIYTYAWIGPNGVTYTTPSIADLIAGSYSVVVTDDQGNSIIGGYNVDQPAELIVNSSTVVGNSCFGQTNGSISVELTGGVSPYSYSWNGGPAQPENSINQLSSGNYTVLAIDANGCVQAADFTIVEPAEITSQNVITDALCFGDANGSAAVTISGGVAPYTYLWTGTGNQTTEATGLAAGNYSVQVMDANGCLQDVGIIIGQPDQIGVNITQIVDATGPTQNDGSITIQVVGGTEPYTVTWNNGATGLSIQGLLPGEYNYTVVDAHGCIYASTTPVVINHSVATTEPDGSKYVTILPNPSNGKVIIKWQELPSFNSSLSLMTLDGRKLYSYEMVSKEGTWDLNHLGLSEGVYIVLLKYDQQVFPYKLIVL